MGYGGTTLLRAHKGVDVESKGRRTRKPGGVRKRSVQKARKLEGDLEYLIEPTPRGVLNLPFVGYAKVFVAWPMSSSKWAMKPVMGWLPISLTKWVTVQEPRTKMAAEGEPGVGLDL